MKTLLLALISPGKSRGTRHGAIRGLVGIGKEAVRKGLIEGGGTKVIGSECSDDALLVADVMVRSFPVEARHLTGIRMLCACCESLQTW
jgi:transcription initiation factor TFIID subunit 6